MGGVRPIAVGELIRRIAGKLLVSRYQAEAAVPLAPLQVGVGFAGGAEAIIHKTRGWLDTAPPDHCLLQCDFTNAYNSLSRQRMLEAVASECPVFLPYARACYGQHADLFGPGFRLSSQQGGHQGDPLGPLFYAMTAHPLALLADAAPGCWTHWYLDDGCIAGPRSVVAALVPQLESVAAPLGLVLNRKKCQILELSDEGWDPAFLPDIPRLGHSGALSVLGSPVGSTSASVEVVSSSVLKPLDLALRRLQELGDPRAASLILRSCLSACRLNWILRTTPPSVSSAAVQVVEPLLRQSWSVILGHQVSDPEWILSSLPICCGGAGMTLPSLTADAAFVSSWISAAKSDSTLRPRLLFPDWIEATRRLAMSPPQFGPPSACHPGRATGRGGSKQSGEPAPLSTVVPAKLVGRRTSLTRSLPI